MTQDPTSIDPRTDGNLVFQARLLFIAAVIYQVILAYTTGLYSFYPLMILISVIVISWSMVLLPVQERSERSIRTAVEIAGAGLMLQGCFLVIYGVSSYYVPRNSWDSRVVLMILAAMLMIASSLLCRGPWVGKRGIWLLGFLHFFMGCWTVWLAPKPYIDVWLFHQDSAAAFLQGINPYSITFRNMYLRLEPPGQLSRFYSAEVQQGDRVMFGFPYPPLSFLTYLPSYILTHESRYAHALALTLCGVLMARLSGGRLAMSAGILLLTAPATWQIIHSAWTEPFLLLALVLSVMTALKWPKAFPVVLGLFFVMKQYTIIFIPLVWLLLPRPLSWRSSLVFLGLMGLSGAIVSLPLALWDWKAFWHSTITIQMMQPFRFDATSFLAMVANAMPATVMPDGTIKDFQPPQWWSWIPFILLIPTWIVLLWRLPRTLAGFVLGVALTSIIFLFFNRQSFLNYHSFAAGCLLLYVAVSEAQVIRAKGEVSAQAAASVVK